MYIQVAKYQATIFSTFWFPVRLLFFSFFLIVSSHFISMLHWERKDFNFEERKASFEELWNLLSFVRYWIHGLNDKTMIELGIRKISGYARRSITCLCIQHRQIIDLLATDKSRDFAETNVQQNLTCFVSIITWGTVIFHTLRSRNSSSSSSSSTSLSSSKS